MLVRQLMETLEEEAFETCRRIARTEGVLAGISSGAAVSDVSIGLELVRQRVLERITRRLTDMGCEVVALSDGLTALGIEPGDRVALISENRPEWLIAKTMPRSMTQMRLALPYFSSMRRTMSSTVVTSAVLPAKTS